MPEMLEQPIIRNALYALTFFAACGPLGAQAHQPAAASANALAREVIAREAEYQRDQITDRAALGAMLDKDFLDVHDGIWNRDQLLDLLSKIPTSVCHFSDVKMENEHVTLISPEIATITYVASQSLSCVGRTGSLTTNAASVWVKRGGHWYLNVHTEAGARAKRN